MVWIFKDKVFETKLERDYFVLGYEYRMKEEDKRFNKLMEEEVPFKRT